MSMKYLYICLFLVFGFIQIQAQQLGLSNQYNLNPYYFNPAFAGHHGATQVLLGARRQWVGFDGAPIQKYVSVNSMLYKTMGAGLIANVEELGLLQKFQVKGSYSYSLKLNEKHELAFGLSGIYKQKSFQFSRIDADDMTDQNLTNQNFEKATNFNVDAGVRYAFDQLQLGVAVHNLLGAKAKFDQGNTLYTDAMHIYSSVSYKYSLSKEKIDLTPFWTMAYSSPRFLWDLGLKTDYKNTFSISLAYRSNSSFIASVGANISEVIQVGYAFENGFGTNLYALSPNTHEVFVGFTIGAKSKKLEQEKKLLEESNLVLKTQTDSLKQLHDMQAQELEKAKQELDAKDKEYQDKLSQMQPKTNNASPAITSDVPVASHQEQLSGNSGAEINPENLGKGHYIVVKSFIDKAEAQKNMTEITAKGYKPFLVFNKNRKYYYIYLEKFDNLSTALKELENVKTSGFKDAWLYLHQ